MTSFAPPSFDRIRRAHQTVLWYPSLGPRLSRGSCHTPDPCRSQLTFNSSNASESSSSTSAFMDHNSGVVFCSLYTASGERITTHEFQSKRHRVLAPTLRLVIPSGGSSSSSLPGFALTLPSPISPTQYLSSPVFLPAPRPFTCASYLAASARAPLSSRVPNLPPQRCPHTLFRLTSTIAAPPPSRCCALCSLQHLACDIWWGSRGSMLCAPHLPAAASTQTTRAVYYALRLPLGRREPGCVDSDVVAAIKRQAPRVSSSRSASNSSGVGIESSVSVVTSSSVPLRIKRIFRRAGHVLSALSRVHMIPIRRTVRRIIPRRRVVLRP